MYKLTCLECLLASSGAWLISLLIVVEMQLAGGHGRTTFNKAKEIHSLLFHTACMLMNRIWRLRGNYPRGERYFHGQWEWWEVDYCEHQEEYRAMYRNLNDYNP